MLLGVNIDHIATLREARKINDPNPLDAISIVKLCGADQITIHLREDRRHINDSDTTNIIKYSSLPVNLECAIDRDIIDIVYREKPFRATLVPEKREEVTTEGGLDLIKYKKEIATAIARLKESDIEVSLFIDPDLEMIKVASELGADIVELHTGSYANIYAMLYSNLINSPYSIKELELSRGELEKLLKDSINRIKISSKLGVDLGLRVAAGHGLNYQNVKEIVEIDEIFELNIGQSIIARSVFSGLERAILDMLELIKK